MTKASVIVALPGGGTRAANVPRDMHMTDVLVELIRGLGMPDCGPEARSIVYGVRSRGLRRDLMGNETPAEAHVPQNDRWILTAEITAGAGPSNVAESPRMRRLRGDFELMQELAGRTNLISFVAQSPRPNLPPERYIVTFKCKSIGSVDRQGNPIFSDRHQVEIYLHNQYPQRWPGMKWLTPIWHPNINHLNGSVCIDAAWWTASRSLDRLVIMLGEMLQYKNYHDDPTKPPFPWDPEAARWSREYRKKHPNIFPVDTRELMRPERVKLNEGGAAPRQKAGIRLSPAAVPSRPVAVQPPAANSRPTTSVLKRPGSRAMSIHINAASPGDPTRPHVSTTSIHPKAKVKIK